MALHDDLTALPNRVLFGDRVEQGIRAAARMSEPLALLTLDLNGFKHVNDMLGHVNDMLGHQCGDLLLRLVAERLLGCLRDSDTIARLGGDEFGILPAGPTDLAGAAAIAWKVQQALAPTFVVRGVETEVTASIGIALLPDHGDNIDDLLRRADLIWRVVCQGGVRNFLHELSSWLVWRVSQEGGASGSVAALPV